MTRLGYVFLHFMNSKFRLVLYILLYLHKEDMVSIKSINGSTTKEYVEYKFGTVTEVLIAFSSVYKAIIPIIILILDKNISI